MCYDFPQGFDPRARFIFEGIGNDERIGDFGILGGGARVFGRLDRLGREPVAPRIRQQRVAAQRERGASLPGTRTLCDA